MEHHSTDRAARWWPLIAASWLLLLIFIAHDVLTEADTPFRRALAIGALLAFGIIYALLVLRCRYAGGLLARRAVAARGVLLAALVGLTLALYLLGAPRTMPPWIFVFVVLAVGVVLPTRPALLGIVVVVALATAVGIAAIGRQLGFITMIVGLGVVGGSAVATTRLILTIGELQRARREIARLAVSEERLRFARDLHDLLGHSLSLIALKSELAGHLLPAQPGRAAAEIGDIERVARDALREVREAVAGYRQPTLTAELESARAILVAAGVAADLDEPPTALPPSLDALLAWVVREGVTNVIRHSGARHCAIRIARAEDAMIVTIADDGHGTSDSATGSGLAGLTERVAALSGTMECGNVPGGGYRLRIAAPIEPISVMAQTPARVLR